MMKSISTNDVTNNLTDVMTNDNYNECINLIQKYSDEILKLKEYIHEKVGFGYPLSAECPKCNATYTNSVLCVRTCPMRPHHVTSHYTHLCLECMNNITQAYAQLHTFFINKRYKVKRSSGVIEIFKVMCVFPTIYFDELKSAELSCDMSSMDEIDIKLISLRDIFELNK